MFTFTERTTFEWPVKVRVPVDGGFEDFEFKGEFVIIDADEIFDAKKSGLDQVKTVFTGWSGIKTADGQKLAVTEENKVALLKQSHIRTGVFNAYLDAIRGAVHIKNSEPLPD